MSRKPDYWLKAMDKSTNQKRKVGAGWNNPDGSISINIDAWTVLPTHKDMVYNLFPIERGVNTDED